MYCQNGGTCIDEVCFNYTCSCPSTFTSDNHDNVN